MKQPVSWAEIPVDIRKEALAVLQETKIRDMKTGETYPEFYIAAALLRERERRADNAAK